MVGDWLRPLYEVPQRSVEYSLKFSFLLTSCVKLGWLLRTTNDGIVLWSLNIMSQSYFVVFFWIRNCVAVNVSVTEVLPGPVSARPPPEAGPAHGG